MTRFLLCLAAAVLLAPTPARAQGFPGTDIYLLTLSDPDSLIADSGSLRNLTARPGYDNQPSFSPDGRTLFYSSARGDQTDIYRVDVVSGESVPVALTPESEFSPLAIPDGSGIAVVRIEADSTQRLWRLPAGDGVPELILPEVRGVGYQAWLDENRVALFILGEPHELRLADVRTGEVRFLIDSIGRSVLRIPGTDHVSFLHVEGISRSIKEVDPGSAEIRPIAPALQGSEDVAWTPGGRLLMAQGFVLTAWNPAGEGAWETIAALGGRIPGKITRLAVSPDGRTLALVVDETAGS